MEWNPKSVSRSRLARQRKKYNLRDMGGFPSRRVVKRAKCAQKVLDPRSCNWYARVARTCRVCAALGVFAAKLPSCQAGYMFTGETIQRYVPLTLRSEPLHQHFFVQVQHLHQIAVLSFLAVVVRVAYWLLSDRLWLQYLAMQQIALRTYRYEHRSRTANLAMAAWYCRVPLPRLHSSWCASTG